MNTYDIEKWKTLHTKCPLHHTGYRADQILSGGGLYVLAIAFTEKFWEYATRHYAEDQLLDGMRKMVINQTAPSVREMLEQYSDDHNIHVSSDLDLVNIVLAVDWDGPSGEKMNQMGILSQTITGKDGRTLNHILFIMGFDEVVDFASEHKPMGLL